MLRISFLGLLFFTFLGIKAQPSFELIPLGVYGGGYEGNLSAYLLCEKGSQDYVALDAGTLRSGITRAIQKGQFYESSQEVLQKRIKAYFISHGHLDHLAGLIINSPDDKGPKPIYGIPFTLEIMQEHYFTNQTWSNFANKGDEPALKTYTYSPIADGGKFVFKGTPLKGQIFELSHGNPYKGSAVLVTNSKGNSVLYFGDTGADRIEQSDRLKKVWTAVAPLVRSGQLKAIMIENSYDNTRDEKLLFGHLTPRLLNEELMVLADLAGRSELSDLKVILTHLKPGGNRIERIKKNWVAENPLQVDVIFPVQGDKISL